MKTGTVTLTTSMSGTIENNIWKPILGTDFNFIKKEKKYPGVFNIDNKEVYIKEVIYSNPATIILWSDGERTVVKCASVDTYSEETGLVMCIMKRLCGGKKMKSITNAWLPDVPNTLTQTRVTLRDVIRKEDN